MKNLLLLCTLLWASLGQSAELYIGFESQEYDNRACSNDWRHSGNTLKQFFFELNYEVYPRGVCTTFSRYPEDIKFASYVVFRGSEAEIQTVIEAAKGLRFEGEFISFDYRVNRIENEEEFSEN